jgi:CDP-diacylglycerol--glycerol-3-phosphate 3-phosphatidyltransferase
VATYLTAPASVAGSARALPPLASWPNLVTALRTVAAVVLGAAALAEASALLLVTAYATYWLGDVLDGWLARRLDQETRFGAVLDVIGDRASCAVLCAGLIVLQPQLWPAVAVFLVQFMVVDCLASLSFLHWPLLSYNYFDRVDRQVWLLNWSRPAKALNTVSVVLVAVAGAPLLALVVASAQLVLKVWTAQRVWTLIQSQPRQPA